LEFQAELDCQSRLRAKILHVIPASSLSIRQINPVRRVLEKFF